jgi:prefoldin subunit 5
VKIERVIDGKEEIDELQAAIFELEQQLKQITQDKDYLAEDLKKWQKNFEDLNELKLKL